MIISFAILALFVGCNGQHCIKVGGNYEGVNGELEYCFDAGKTQEIGSPVVSSSQGKEYVGITENEAKKIVEALEPETIEEKEDKVYVKNLNPKSYFSRLKDFLKK